MRTSLLLIKQCSHAYLSKKLYDDIKCNDTIPPTKDKHLSPCVPWYCMGIHLDPMLCLCTIDTFCIILITTHESNNMHVLLKCQKHQKSGWLHTHQIPSPKKWIKMRYHLRRSLSQPKVHELSALKPCFKGSQCYSFSYCFGQQAAKASPWFKLCLLQFC